MAESIFISYRRNTGHAYAGRLHDTLVARFGTEHVFMDVDSIELAEDFAVVLDEALRQCRAVLVIIDPGWLDALDPAGRRRLDDPADFVRMEIEHSLSFGHKIFPVLVGGALMPQAVELPEPLRALAGRQAVEITPTRYGYDSGRLVTALEKILGTKPKRRRRDDRSWWGGISRRMKLAIGGLAVLVVLGAGALLFALRPEPTGWQVLPDAPTALEGAAAAAYRGQLWVAGGVSAGADRALLDAVNIYDSAHRKWSQGPALPEPVAFASMVNTGDELMLIGGQTQAGAVDTVLRLDDQQGWVKDTALPEAREAGGAVWDGSRVLYAGGVGTDHAAKGEVYAYTGGTWQQVGTLSVAREKVAALSDGFGTSWIIGGRDRATNTPAYGNVDVITVDSISQGQPVSPVHSAAGLWFPGAGPCVIAGDTGSRVSSAVQCLRGADLVPALPAATAGPAAAALDQDVYVIGGYRQGTHGSSTLLMLAGAGQ